MQDDYDLAKLEMIREKYRQNCDKGIPLLEIYTPEEHLYIMKYIFKVCALGDGFHKETDIR